MDYRRKYLKKIGYDLKNNKSCYDLTDLEEANHQIQALYIQNHMMRDAIHSFLNLDRSKSISEKELDGIYSKIKKNL